MAKIAKGYSLFMNWFNGICSVICGGWMMLSVVPSFPLQWETWMPLSVLGNFPLHDLFFTSFFWPGLALLLVNGMPNIIALVFRFKGNLPSWRKWCLIAGALLVLWTAVEMVFMPNGASVLYMVLGVLQLIAALRVRSHNEK